MMNLPDRLLMADGAWGTEIQRRGLARGKLPESWNLEAPEKVEALAGEYVAAGCDIILTNTFGANRFVLKRYNLEEKVAEINRRGAAISRKAAGAKIAVFGSMGPTGLLPSVEDVDEALMASAFREQAAVLQDAGADGLVIETMSDLAEFRLAVRAAAATGLPTCGCMTFDSGPGRVHTMMGVAVEEAARIAEEEGAAFVGANCGAGMENYLDVVKRFRAASRLPVWVKPNAGLPEIHSRTIAYAMTPDRFIGYARDLAAAGVRVIGGCCGTSPVLIAELVRRLKPEGPG
jgi:5-methyltetrahydrofolate--homocysteine methyltransferase